MNLITSIVLATTDDEQLDLAKTYNRQIEEYVQQGLFKQALPLAKTLNMLANDFRFDILQEIF